MERKIEIENKIKSYKDTIEIHTKCIKELEDSLKIIGRTEILKVEKKLIDEERKNSKLVIENQELKTENLNLKREIQELQLKILELYSKN